MKNKVTLSCSINFKSLYSTNALIIFETFLTYNRDGIILTYSLLIYYLKFVWIPSNGCEHIERKTI